jgi:hypothetical protein
VECASECTWHPCIVSVTNPYNTLAFADRRR